MFCPKCGQWNAGSATRCTACGASLLPPGVADAPAPPQQTEPTAAPITPSPSYPNQPPPGGTPSAYPSSAPPQPAYPAYPQPGPSNAPVPPQVAPAYSQPSYGQPNYSQPTYPAYPQAPYPGAPSAPDPLAATYPHGGPAGYPSYSPLPTYSPLPPGPSSAMPPGGYNPAYPAAYPGQMPQTYTQCKVCGSGIPYRFAGCPVCLVPVGLIANPADPTVTTYLDARALTQPGTSPVYAAPGAYAGRAVDTTPEEVKRGWNWGAALNSTLWSFAHRAPGWGLLCGCGLLFWVITIFVAATLSPSDRHGTATDSTSAIMGALFVGTTALMWLFKTLYLGFQGNAIAWRSGRYPNPSRLRITQKQWAYWSILVFLLGTGALIGGMVIVGSH